MESETVLMEFQRIVDDNKQRIFRICRIYSIPPVEPEDLFQEVIYEIWKSIDSFRGQSSVSTWVCRVALNVCIRAKQKHQARDRRMVRLDNIHIETIPDRSHEPPDDRFDDLRQCISGLKEAERSLVVLHLDELPYRDIAGITGLSENTVAVKLKRIRAKLLECMRAKQTY
jgi:RNA polymerase sigma factor (sigma-70 family)